MRRMLLTMAALGCLGTALAPVAEAAPVVAPLAAQVAAPSPEVQTVQYWRHRYWHHHYWHHRYWHHRHW